MRKKTIGVAGRGNSHAVKATGVSDLEYAARLRDTCNSGDAEADHAKADAVICELLELLGFTETVRAYEEVDKWFA